jgi:copper chaperone
MEQTKIFAPDISCGHCVGAIKRAVGSLEGVNSVEGDPQARTVQISYDSSKVDLARIKQVMTDEGYPPADGQPS